MATKPQCTPGENRSVTVRDMPLACADETAAVEMIERLRWDDSPACPRCGSVNVYKMVNAKTGARNARFLWRCRECPKAQSQFTWRIGTVMEDSRIPARCWCYAFWRASTSKKGVAAKEIQRQCGLSYKASLFLLNRVRLAMDEDPTGLMTGTIEADETYIGPRRPRYRIGKTNEPRGTRKQPVMALVERGGRVHSRVVPDVTGPTLKGVIREMAQRKAIIITDEWTSYLGLGKEFADHRTVNHGRHEYVKADGTHTNTIESYFALVKRGLVGIWHAVSRKHLHRYLSSCNFRYNHRGLEDGERVALAVRSSAGKRLMYWESIA